MTKYIVENSNYFFWALGFITAAIAATDVNIWIVVIFACVSYVMLSELERWAKRQIHT